MSIPDYVLTAVNAILGKEWAQDVMEGVEGRVHMVDGDLFLELLSEAACVSHYIDSLRNDSTQ